MFRRLALACPHSRVQRVSAMLAALFGIASVVAGGRLLLGFGEAGYAVVRPVLVFNTVMGVLYLVAAALIVRNVARGQRLAALIAVVNVAVLVAIIVLRSMGGTVANETLVAMTLRAAVWAGIALMLRRDLARSVTVRLGADVPR